MKHNIYAVTNVEEDDDDGLVGTLLIRSKVSGSYDDALRVALETFTDFDMGIAIHAEADDPWTKEKLPAMDIDVNGQLIEDKPYAIQPDLLTDLLLFDHGYGAYSVWRR